MYGLIFLIATVVLPGTAQTKANIQDLAWMKGSWSCPMWGGTFEEHWAAPAGATMIGMGRLTGQGKTNFMEFLSIEPAKGGLTMWILLDAPSKGPKTAVPFRLSRVSKSEAVWENPQNDFPSKITYKAVRKDRINCRIEGMQNGKASHEDFLFRRMK